MRSMERGVGNKSEPPHVGSYKINPAIIPDLHAIDAIVGDLIDFFSKRGVQVVLLSEYGITNVDTPVHLNRIFRQQGWLTVKDELGLEILDAGASKVFAVADHQVAHIYLNDASLEKSVRDVLEKTSTASERFWARRKKSAAGIDHPRAGDLMAVAQENAWFTYYYWLDDARAPDFARTVDIHRKPGFDPVELFLDPKIPLPKLKIAWRLLQKKLGFRMLMDVVPLDATLVKGSHGRRPADKKDWPVFITERPEFLGAQEIESTDVFHALLRHLNSSPQLKLRVHFPKAALLRQFTFSVWPCRSGSRRGRARRGLCRGNRLWLAGFAFLEQHGVFVIEIFQFHARDFLADEPFDGEHVAGVLGGHDGEGVAACLRAARAPDAMDVILRMLRHVVVDDVAHVRDVESARGDVRGDEHFKSSVAETLERLLAFALGAVGMQHRHGVIVALEQSAQCGRRRASSGRRPAPSCNSRA